MPAGTIALTNNSTAITGSGTSFTTELKAGDFVYVNVGGAPFTLVVASISSDTQLYVAVAFDGPTTSGLSWNAVPASVQVAITQKILNDFASVARGRILDFQNWQKIYSDAQSVTVTRPDRTTFTGPSWGYMATQFGNKMEKTQNLKDLSDIAAARSNLGFVNGTLPVSLGGSGATTASAARTNFGVGYSNSAANPGGGVYRLFMTDDSGRMFITRRFNVTAKANSATAFSYGWKDDGAGAFVGYPGCSVMGESGNSANFKVGTESLTSTGVSGFIHNTGSTDLSVWLTFIVVGMKA